MFGAGLIKWILLSCIENGFLTCFHSLLVVSGMYEHQDFNILTVINHAPLCFNALASFKYRWDKRGGLKGDRRESYFLLPFSWPPGL
jgi:hypothetical protein